MYDFKNLFILHTSYFIKYLIRAKNQHGVHSPFVYDLVTKCFYKKTNKTIINEFLKYKKKLLKEHRTLKTAEISTKKALFLIRFVQYFSPKNILELGTSLGFSTRALYLGNPKSNITTLENCPETLKGSIKNKKFDLIYFHRNHQKKTTLSCFKSCLSTIDNNSIFIFNDIYRSKELAETWNIIKQHPKVTVTIDLFHLGIVFFRKEQAKEHFTIRL